MDILTMMPNILEVSPNETFTDNLKVGENIIKIENISQTKKLFGDSLVRWFDKFVQQIYK